MALIVLKINKMIALEANTANDCEASEIFMRLHVFGCT